MDRLSCHLCLASSDRVVIRWTAKIFLCETHLALFTAAYCATHSTDDQLEMPVAGDFPDGQEERPHSNGSLVPLATWLEYVLEGYKLCQKSACGEIKAMIENRWPTVCDNILTIMTTIFNRFHQFVHTFHTEFHTAESQNIARITSIAARISVSHYSSSSDMINYLNTAEFLEIDVCGRLKSIFKNYLTEVDKCLKSPHSFKETEEMHHAENNEIQEINSEYVRIAVTEENKEAIEPFPPQPVVTRKCDKCKKTVSLQNSRQSLGHEDHVFCFKCLEKKNAKHKNKLLCPCCSRKFEPGERTLLIQKSVALAEKKRKREADMSNQSFEFCTKCKMNLLCSHLCRSQGKITFAHEKKRAI